LYKVWFGNGNKKKLFKIDKESQKVLKTAENPIDEE
jgi:hypothetical protein